MKKTASHSKTILFLMEMIFVLLFLALSSTACIRIFAAAKMNHTQAQEWRQIQMLTTSVGEILEGSNGTAESFVLLLPDGNIQGNAIEWYYDNLWNSCSSSQASYEMELTLSEASLSRHGTLTFYRCPDHVQIYTIDLAFPDVSTSEEAIS